MSALFRDLRYGLRTLRNNPGFVVVAVLTLALGLGANTAIFTLLYSVVLRPLPYADAGRLTNVYLVANGDQGPQKMPWSYPKYQDLARLTRSFESLAAYSPAFLTVTGDGDPERVSGEYVSATYFPILGIRAARGRLFTADEDQAGKPQMLAVISDELWRRRYGADPGIVGHTVRLNGLPVNVIGILPPGVKGESSDAEVWVPFAATPQLTQIPQRLTSRGSHWHRALGRLKPGVSLAQAAADVRAAGDAMEQGAPTRHPGGRTLKWTAGLEPLGDAKVDPGIRTSLTILFAAIGFVLLIACVNLANLMLGRAIGRRREVAIRLSLGATRPSLVRQFLAESVLLSLLGGLAGLLVAAWGLDLLRFLQPEAAGDFYSSYVRAVDADALKIQAPVVVFSILLSLLTGLLFGLWPALFAARSGTSQVLKGAGEVLAGGGRRRWSLRGALVSAQVALALVLLAGAGLMLRSFARLLATDLGVETSHVLTFKLALPPQKYSQADARNFERDLTARLAALPGVEAAAVSDTLPARGQSNVTIAKIDGQSEAKLVGVHGVSFDFFRLMRVPLVRGRLLSEQDHERAPHVALIDESTARRLFGDEDPIGHRIELGLDGFMTGQERPEIVGVVGDVMYDGPGRAQLQLPGHGEGLAAEVYLSSLQSVNNWPYVVVRAAGNPAALIAAARAEVARLDRELPMYNVKTMEEHVSDATSRSRFSTVLLALFAGLAVALAAIGLYGVISYSVAARTKEIGVRIALGATRGTVLAMVLRDGVLLCALGLGVGLPAAFIGTRVLADLLYQVRPGDLGTFAAVTAVLGVVALLAAFVPAYRACSIDPVRALRAE